MALDMTKVSVNVGDKLRIVGDPVINGNKITYVIQGVKAGLATVTAAYDNGAVKSDTILVEDAPLMNGITVDNNIPYTGEDITVTVSFNKVPLLSDIHFTTSSGLVLKEEPRVDGTTIVVVYTVSDPGQHQIIANYDGASLTTTVDAETPVTLKTMVLDPSNEVTVEQLFTIRLRF